MTPWKLVEGNLLSKWAKDVDPGSPLPEYPRPQLIREKWMNLNGLWEYAIRPKGAEPAGSYDGQILVPFPVESALSGVKRPVKPAERLWYRRKFTVPKAWDGSKLLLHFGAVDWHASVLVNGKVAGEHEGGYVPFSIDITELTTFTHENELVVVVRDPTNKGNQQFGKQALRPSLIFYTAVTGIWQTVWLEPVPRTYVKSFKLTPRDDLASFDIAVDVEGEGEGTVEAKVEVSDSGNTIAAASCPPGSTTMVALKGVKLWSPDVPFLYDLKIRLLSAGNVVDEVGSYFGMRSIKVVPDAKGVPRIALNGQILFQCGPLDQGYWPDGLYSAPTDDALRSDIEAAKDYGFNLIRKHIKVEPDRWYHWCDKLGVLVWQDMPSGNSVYAGAIEGFLRGKIDLEWGRKKQAHKDVYMHELAAMIDALYNHPSIVTWVPFNEGWGQFDTERIIKLIQAQDVSRLINNASGWIDKGVGEMADVHKYPGPGIPEADGKRALVCGEFGGLLLGVPDHVWITHQKFFIYKKSRDTGDLQATYAGLMERLAQLEKAGLSAAVYTQLIDVEIEVNGLLTYDRCVKKLDPQGVKPLHEKLYALLDL